MIGKLRGIMKDAAQKLVKMLEGPELPMSDPLMDDVDEVTTMNPTRPKRGPEIIEHPQYWVETHYTEATPNTPPTEATDVMRTVHKKAVGLLFDCVRIQLKGAVKPGDGEWRASVRDGQLRVEVNLKTEHTLEQVEMACNTAAEIIRTHGIKFGQFPLKVNTQARKALIEMPVNNIDVTIEAPMMWVVLHNNRERPIVWNGKLWLPK